MAGIRPSDFVVSCPATLTDKDWQKKKGTAGKMTKTGLGAELKKLEALLKQVDMNRIDPAALPSKSMAELQNRVEEAKQEYAKSVVPIQKHLATVRKAADDAAAKLKKNPLAKDAVKAATQVSKDAATYAVTCKSLDLVGSVKKAKEDIDRKNDLAAKLLAGSIKKFAQGAGAYLKDPTKDSWETNIKQQGRSVSNSVAQLENYRAKFWTDFEKFKGFDSNTLGLAETDFADRGVQLVKAAVGQVRSIAAFKG